MEKSNDKLMIFQDSTGKYLPIANQPVSDNKSEYLHHNSTRYIFVTSGVNGVPMGRKRAELIKSNKPLPELYKKREECCGCGACYAICPMSGESRPSQSVRGENGELESDGNYQIPYVLHGSNMKQVLHAHTGAITMLPDEEGFLYPVVDAEICIRCYKCLSVCDFKEMSK